MVEMLDQTTPKFSLEMGSRLRFIYLTKHMHDF